MRFNLLHNQQRVYCKVLFKSPYKRYIMYMMRPNHSNVTFTLLLSFS